MSSESDEEPANEKSYKRKENLQKRLRISSRKQKKQKGKIKYEGAVHFISSCIGDKRRRTEGRNSSQYDLSLVQSSSSDNN